MKQFELQDLDFRMLDQDGVMTLVSWAAAEGWNPGEFDALAFFSTDPEGFYGYFFDGTLIAGGAVVSYGREFGFMGLFIVRPEYRSMGIGKKLWFQRRDHLLSRLKPGSAIGMDGVVAMQPFYAQGGFTMQFRSERYHRQGDLFPVSSAVVPYSREMFDDVLTYDTRCFGFSRSDFLRFWLEMPSAHSIVYMVQDKPAGFATLRKVNPGYKIGPLFANTPEIAEALYAMCLTTVPGEPVYLDVPVVNEAAMRMANKFHAEYVFECGRMYYGAPPPLPLEHIFGITTFELG